MNLFKWILVAMALVAVTVVVYMGWITNHRSVRSRFFGVVRQPSLPHFLLLLHSTERLDEWLGRPGHAAFRDGVTWTVLVITLKDIDEQCANAGKRLGYINDCLLCPRVDDKNDYIRGAADVCFKWWLHEVAHDRDDVVMLMEMDVLVRNVTRFLSLLDYEMRQMREDSNRSVTTMLSRETMERFCAADPSLTGYCALGVHYLNGVSLYSPHRLNALGVLKSDLRFGFDTDMAIHLIQNAPERIGVVNTTMVCMMPLANLERVVEWLQHEPECPAWHVFHYLWRREIYPHMRSAIQWYYYNTTFTTSTPA